MVILNKMVLKTILLITSFTLVVNCTRSKDQIVYEFNKELTSKIIYEYNKLETDKSYYVTMNINHCSERYIAFNSCDDCKFKNILNQSNRFLKLNSDILIPVIFAADSLLEKNTKYELETQLGGNLIIEIDNHNNFIQARRSM